MKKKARLKQDEPASWLATFGDLATLLFTFYCLIYASCTYRPGQWETAVSALERMLSPMPGNTSTSLIAGAGDGVLPRNTSVVSTLATGMGLSPAARQSLEARADELEAMASLQEYAGQIDFQASEHGFLFRMANPVAFPSGEARLSSESGDVLRAVASMIRIGPAEVQVEGHTCDLPIRSGRFRSNWELSGARAAEVVRFLTQQGIGNSKISAQACAQYYPLLPNEDEASRRANRRVEIRVTYAQEPTGLSDEIGSQDVPWQ